MKRPLAALAMTAVSILGMMTVAPSANAADGTCTSTTNVWRSYNKNNYVSTVPTTGSGSTSCIMQQGASGYHVFVLQYTLHFCHGYNIRMDHQYGPETAAAVRSFQASKGLAADGIYGPNTRNALSWRFYVTDGSSLACWRL
ncbi:peptidoglycan-binding protein [Streptomyces sp. NPDC056480]|uniref:peptidoglycan-binding domain-containing protein n=1 Tax=Streptomyces sp. NPDC056480 TaxID=3345833 RepID=UPI00369720A6